MIKYKLRTLVIVLPILAAAFGMLWRNEVIGGWFYTRGENRNHHSVGARIANYQMEATLGDGQASFAIVKVEKPNPYYRKTFIVNFQLCYGSAANIAPSWPAVYSLWPEFFDRLGWK